jgi:hypothetical protein
VLRAASPCSEFAADDEGVSDFDAGADSQEREREQESRDQHRTALVAEPAAYPASHGERPASRLR